MQKQDQGDDNSVEEYTPKEIETLDYYHEYTENKFEDDELYEVITKFNYDDKKIKEELDLMMKDLKKGDEYQWQTVGKNQKLVKKKPEVKSVDASQQTERKKKNKNFRNKLNQKENNFNESKPRYFRGNFRGRGGYRGGRGKNNYRNRNNGNQRKKDLRVIEKELPYDEITNIEINEKINEVVVPEKETELPKKIEKEEELKKINYKEEEIFEGKKEITIDKKKNKQDQKNESPKKNFISEETNIYNSNENKVIEPIIKEKNYKLSFNKVKAEEVEIIKEKKETEKKKKNDEIKFIPEKMEITIAEKKENKVEEPKTVNQPKNIQKNTTQNNTNQNDKIPSTQMPNYPQYAFNYPYMCFNPQQPNMQNIDNKTQPQCMYMMYPVLISMDQANDMKMKGMPQQFPMMQMPMVMPQQQEQMQQHYDYINPSYMPYSYPMMCPIPPMQPMDPSMFQKSPDMGFGDYKK
jgi:hypothetical protein